MPNRQPELLMPVSDEGAALQFFVEAMKQNTETLRQVGKTMQGMQDEQKETLRLIHDTRERVIRIETDSMNAKVGELEKMVDELRDEKLRREGAANLATGAITKGPVIVTILASIIVVMIVLVANGKI